MRGASAWRAGIAGALCLLALWLVGARAARAEEPAGKALSPWRDPKVVEARFAEACEAVEKECGAKFGKRPTARISTPAEMRDAVREELEARLRALGYAEQLESVLEAMSKALIGKYDHATHVVHVVPENAETTADGLKRAAPDEDQLRAVLAHEATHALDFERFGLEEALVGRKTVDGIQAVSAVVEGHAQFVAKRVSKAWGITAAFERYTESITAIPPIEDEEKRALAKAAVAYVAFGYVQGLAFMEAVWAAKGREGVERALKDPPAGTRAIEHPDEWLAGPGPAIDAVLAEAAEAFRPLVGAPEWKVISTRLPRAVLDGVAVLLPEEDRAPFLASYRDGHVLVGQVAEEGTQVTAIVLAFATEADAKRYVAAERKASAKKMEEEQPAEPSPVRILDRKIEEGAGPEGRLPGHVVSATIEAFAETVRTRSQTAALGTFAAQVLHVNAPQIERASEDAAIVRLEAFLKDPSPTRKMAKAEAVPFASRLRRVTVLVLDPEGKPVPRARVRFTHGSLTEHTDLVDGKATLTVRKGPAMVGVSSAAAADGTPLEFAPGGPVEVSAEESEVTIRLTKGVAISGTLVDRQGKPLADAEVRAFPRDHREGVHGEPTAVAKPGADGAFRVVGLAEEEYVLVAHAGDARSVSRTNARGGAEGVRVVLDLGVSVVVRVLDSEGRPVSGARVTVGRDFPDFFPPSFQFGHATDAAGRVTLESLDRDASGLVVRPPAARDDLATLREPVWTPASGDVTLAAGFTAKGVVVDEAGKPVPGASVLLRRGSGWTAGTVDSKGRFTIPGLPRAPIEVRAAPPSDPGAPWPHGGDDDADWTKITPEAPEARLVLRPSLEFVVRVTDGDGKPVKSAEVFLDEEHTGQFGREMVDGEARFARPKARFAVHVWAVVAADGRSLAPESREGVEPSQERIEMRLRPGLEIRGRVVDEAGKAVEGVLVEARMRERAPGGWSRSHSGADAEARSGGDGAFRLVGLAEGEHLLGASRGKDLVLHREVRARAGDTDVTLVVSSVLQSVVTVLDWEGKPVEGAEVGARRQAGRDAVPAEGMEERTGPDGKAALRGLDDSRRVWLTVRPPRSREDIDEIVALPETLDPEHVVRLGRTYVVSGRLLDDQGRSAVGRVLVKIPGFSRSFESDTDAVGRFRVRGVRHGPATVQSVQGRWDERAEGPAVEATPESPDVVVRLVQPVKALKIVVPGFGKGRQGLLRREGGAEDDWRSRRTFTLDAEGQAELKTFSPGTYTVWIQPEEDGLCVWATGLPVEGDVLRLEPIPSLSIRVRLTLPEGVTPAEVGAMGPVGPIPARPPADGVHEIRGLPPGKWKVSAKARAPSAWLRASAEVEAGTEVELVPK